MPTSPPRHQPGPKRPAAATHQTPRESAAARGYGYRWRQSAKAYLMRHRLCVHCLEKGRTTVATVVDHIVPHRGDQALFWDVAGNWQALCKPCHDAKTATEDGGFGNKRKDHARAP